MHKLKNFDRIWFWGALFILLLTACGLNSAAEVIVPTRAQPDAIATALLITQHAPPAGFEQISFDPIDTNRDALPSWYFEINVYFTGQYSSNNENADSSMRMQVWQDSVHRSRRVILDFEGGALSGGLEWVEAVRFENDFYILDANGICTQNNAAAREIATLNASDIVGGVHLAVPNGASGEINGYMSYRYGFGREDLTLGIFREAPSLLEIRAGEAWHLPDHNVIVRFGTLLNMHNARILFGDQPVTGELRYDYNLFEIAEPVNIALPNGC